MILENVGYLDLTIDQEVNINESELKDSEYSPVYIILTNTGSQMSKTIRYFTGDSFTHASLAFDSKLKEIFSFNFNGFVKESIDLFKQRFGNILMGVFCVLVPSDGIKYIKDKIQYFSDHIKEYSYNIMGLFGVLFNKPIAKDNKLFCSQFVDSMLKIGQVDVTNKNSALVRPQEFTMSNVIYKLFEGNINDYSDKKVKKNLDKIQKSKINECVLDLYDIYPRVLSEEYVDNIINEVNMMEIREFFDPNLSGPTESIKKAIKSNKQDDWKYAYKSMEVFTKELNRRHTKDGREWVYKYLQNLSKKCDIGYVPGGPELKSMQNDCQKILKIIKDKSKSGTINEEMSISANIKGENIYEAYLSTEERNKLRDEDFGLPKDRKYPLIDKTHILQAIRWFNKCEPKKQKELAKNIIDAVVKNNMKVNITHNNELFKYINKDNSNLFYIKEEDESLPNDDCEYPWETYQDGFYHPDEIIELINDIDDEEILFDNVTIKEWFNYYQDRCNGAIYYNETYERAWYNRLKIANESEMKMLGWNPELEFNSYNRKIASKRLVNEINNRLLKENYVSDECQAIINGGYMDNNRWNSLYISPEYPDKLLRKRVEIMIFKDESLYMYIHDGKYEIPGGGIEPNVLDIQQVLKEAQEEAHINCKDVQCSGIRYIRLYSQKEIDSIDVPIKWDGEETLIFAGKYDSEYKGNVESIDKYPQMLKNGKFYDYMTIKDSLTKEHKKCCMWYLYGFDDVLTEAEAKVSVNNKGDLVLNKHLNFQREFNKSHNLLLSYEKTNNFDGMKYELTKLWYINAKLEEKIDVLDSIKRKDFVDIRARVLNDFNKYIKIVNTNDNTFNFGEYIKSTPYDPDNIVISKNSINMVIDITKKIIQRT